MAEELVLPCSQSSCVSPCCAPSAMVIHLESLVALSPPAKSAADCLHPLTFQGPTSTAVAVGASATSRFCPWGLTGLCFACSSATYRSCFFPAVLLSQLSLSVLLPEQHFSVVAVPAPWGSDGWLCSLEQGCIPCRVMSAQGQQ